MEIQDIAERLQRYSQHATYGAIAEAVGGTARGIGQRLGVPSLRNSYVVNKQSRQPTGYPPHLIETMCTKNMRLISIGAELIVWLTNHP